MCCIFRSANENDLFMQHIKSLNVKVQKLAKKANGLAEENRYLKRELKRIRSSQALWKEKAKDRRKLLFRYERQMKPHRVGSGAEDSRPRERESFSGVRMQENRPGRHRYSSFVISLCLCIRLSGNCSLRGGVEVLREVSRCLGLDMDLPSFTSIRNWELKKSYYHLYKEVPASGSYIFILDESICIGKESVLLILAVPEGCWQAGKSLGFADVRPVYIGVEPSWKAARIGAQLGQLLHRGMRCAYVVSDGGNNLCRCFKDLGWIRIEDCFHALGNLLEKRYEKDPHFEEFSRLSGQFKRRVSISAYAAFMPPAQRSKGRFLNLAPLAEWAYKTLKLMERPDFQADDKLRQWLAWLLDFKPFIEELHCACQAFHQLCFILKPDGLSRQSAALCRKALEECRAPAWFTQGAQAYLNRNLEHATGDKPLLCSSDVIESLFGKYKATVKNSSAGGVTESCLNIAGWGKPLDEHTVTQAMEAVCLKDIHTWRNENLRQNINQKRRELYRN
jgi:hypothetical protein